MISSHKTTALAFSTLIFSITLLLAFIAPQATGAPLAQITPTGVQAEAMVEANLRAGPGIEYDIVGTIYSGVRYRVYGQHEFFPWLLLEYPPAPGGMAWVFAELVTLTVPLAQLPVVADVPQLAAPSPSPTLLDTAPPDSAPAATFTPLPPSAVYLTVQDEVNVRFGPGVDYPRIGRLNPGVPYTVVSRHSLFPWLLIEIPDSPNGVGWVFQDVVDVTGDLYTLPVITAEEIGWPTLTPTPPFVVTAVPPWSTATPAPAEGLAVDMQQLGADILAYLLSQGFIPEDDRFGSVTVIDLATGDNFSLGADIAYSGMSLIKIPILLTYYRTVYQPADAQQAEMIANTMICSGNHTANGLLSFIGGGDPFVGAQAVSQTMQDLGLENTYILTPFVLDEPLEPTIPIVVPETNADQSRAEPDPYNQTTPEDLGWLLRAVYQCAMDESGPLLEDFADEFTPTECRQMLLTMSANQINVLTEAGVPIGTQVAHKHGWIDDTHGDAAVVFTPGGDFALTMALHQPDWLPYEESWPTMAEIARMVYNAYNPDAPLAAIHPATVDETCELQGNPLLAALSAPVITSIE